jgi:hypothetical protein
MEQYRKRTQGTRTQMKQSSVTWSFRDADVQYGKMQAAELKTHLESFLVREANYPVVIVSGDKCRHLRSISVGAVIQRYPDTCRTGIYHTIAQILLVLTVKFLNLAAQVPGGAAEGREQGRVPAQHHVPHGLGAERGHARLCHLHRWVSPTRARSSCAV